MRITAKSGSPWQYTKPWIYRRAQFRGLGWGWHLALEEVWDLEPQYCGQASWICGGQGCWGARVLMSEKAEIWGRGLLGVWWASLALPVCACAEVPARLFADTVNDLFPGEAWL